MGYKVIWTERSLADLFNACSYIAENPDAAERLGGKLIRHVTLLEPFPELGPFARGPVRSLVDGNYRIFYKVHADEKMIEIKHVRHCARAPIKP